MAEAAHGWVFVAPDGLGLGRPKACEALESFGGAATEPARPKAVERPAVGWGVGDQENDQNGWLGAKGTTKKASPQANQGNASSFFGLFAPFARIKGQMKRLRFKKAGRR